jgi:hypothetical protein
MTEPNTDKPDLPAEDVAEPRTNTDTTTKPWPGVYQLPLRTYSEQRGADLFPGFSRLFK